MRALLKFEFMRFWKNKKNLFIFLIMFISIIVLLNIFKFLDMRHRQKYINDLNFEKESVQEYSPVIILDLAIYEDLDDKELFRDEIEELSKKRDLIRNWFATFVDMHAYRRDIVKRLPYEIRRNEIVMQYIDIDDFEAGRIAVLESDKEALRRETIVKRYLLENNIIPLSSPYELNMQNFIYRLLSYPLSLIWIIMVIISCIDIVTEDFGSGTYKQIYSQNYTRGQVYFIKWISGVLNSAIMWFGLMLFVGIYFAFKGSLGNFNYPVYTAFKGILPYKTYLLLQVPFILISWLTIVAMINLVGFLIKELLNVFIFMFALLLSDFILRDFVVVTSIVWKISPLNILGLNEFINIIDSFKQFSIFSGIQSIWLIFIYISGYKKLKTMDL